jgi:hypothetical protein
MNKSISDPFAVLLQSQQDEIAMYKWTESERAGFDIGWKRASDEWFDRHFPAWAREQYRLIDEALSAADYDTQLSARSSAAVVAH